MGYRKEIYAKAFEIKNEALKKSAAEYEKKLSELRDNSEEYRDIELGLSKLGPAIALAAMSADDNQFARFREMSEKLCARKKELFRENGITAPGVMCDKCRDTGYSGGELCDCVKDIAKTIVAEEMSRSMPIGNCSFQNFDLSYYSDSPDESGRVPSKRAAAILSSAKDFVKDFPASKSLLFMGEPGLGKTHLSLAIVSAVSDKGYSVVYGPAGKLFSEVEKEHFSYNGDTEKLDSLLSADLLVIDDLGTEFLSAFTSSLFYNIVNTRLLEGKPTIISTNLSIDELEKKYSNRIASRFMGNYDAKLFIGDDIRQQKAYK